MKRFLLITLFLTALLGISSVIWADTGYVAGGTYSFTVNSPTSEDGAIAQIWGFCQGTSETYGSGIFNDGVATVVYTVPTRYTNSFLWEVQAYQSVGGKTITTRYNTQGQWPNFDIRFLDDETIELSAYEIEDFTLSTESASMTLVGKDNLHPASLDVATVEILKPWSGSIEDYDNSVYNDTALYNKKGFNENYAYTRGYTLEVTENPNATSFQQIKVSKVGTDFEITLFGRLNNEGTEANHDRRWDTTFYIEYVANIVMVYDSLTGIASGTFDTPLDYTTQYFIQPAASKNVGDGIKHLHRPGSMDLLLSGGTIPAPVTNVTQNIGYGSIQEAIDDPSTVAGDVIEVAPGTYNEAVTINKGITLKATGTAAETIINCPDGVLTTGVYISGTDLGTVTVEGFTVKGWTESGIVQGTSSVLGTTVHVLNNIVESNDTYMRNGIQVSGDGSSVVGNYVEGAPLTPEWSSAGIHVVDASNIHVANNTVNTSYDVDFGISVYRYDVSKNDITNITIENNFIYAKTGIAITGRDASSAKLIDNVVIQNNNISAYNNGVNVQKINMGNLTIMSNSIEHKSTGIRFSNSSNVTGNVIAHENIIFVSPEHTDSTWGVTNQSSTACVIDARENYWGDATGPYHYTHNQEGLRSSQIYGDVLFDPWYGTQAMETGDLESNMSVENVTQNAFYNTIQAAIDAAVADDVIHVAPGTYNEAVTINRGITLKATGTAAETIINCPDGELTTGVYISGTDLGTVTVEGFTVKGWTENGIVQGRLLCLGTTVHILNNIVESNGTYMRNGIQVSGSGSSVISNSVYGATLTETWAGTGIHAINASDVLVKNNYVTGSDIGICTYNYEVASISGCQVLENELESNKNGVRVQGTNANPNIVNITIDGNIITGGEKSIHARRCSIGAITITNNTISSASDCGVYLNGENVSIDGDLFISENDFSVNDKHVEVPLGQENLLPGIQAGNNYDHSFIIDNQIVSDVVGTYLYVDVPDPVISNNVTSIYTVKATEIADLRSFKVVLKVPKADFMQPVHLGEPLVNDFKIGSAYSEYETYGLETIQFSEDATDYIYEVTGAYWNAFPGITGLND